MVNHSARTGGKRGYFREFFSIYHKLDCCGNKLYLTTSEMGICKMGVSETGVGVMGSRRN